MRALLLAALAATSLWPVNPNRVLILVNDSMPAESGTSGAGASVYVGTHYASARSIPGGNVLHLTCDTTQTTTLANYQSQIETPVKAFLDASSGAMKHQILYIVPTYGVPWGITGSPNGTMALDSIMAAMYDTTSLVFGTPSYLPGRVPFNQAIYLPGSAPWTTLWAPSASPPLAFEPFADQRENAGGWKMFVVTRLDGLTALKSAALVDIAIAAESSLVPTAGTAYWDWGGSRNSTEFQLYFDTRVRDGAVLTTNLAITTYLHRQTTGSFPEDPLPASPPVTHSSASRVVPSSNAILAFVSAAGSDCCGFPVEGQYSWITGGIGSGFVSCSGTNLRNPAAENPGTSDRWGCSYMGRFLEDGAAGVWGVTDEPAYSIVGNFHPNGIDIANYLYNGYNFGDSVYLSTGALRWVIHAAGDPLYQPHGITNKTSPTNRSVRVRGATSR